MIVCYYTLRVCSVLYQVIARGSRPDIWNFPDEVWETPEAAWAAVPDRHDRVVVRGEWRGEIGILGAWRLANPQQVVRT